MLLRLEHQFQCELNVAVLDAAVFNRATIGGRVRPNAAGGRNDWSRGERAHIKVAVHDIQIGVVEDVITFRSKLQFEAFRHSEVLIYAHIESPQARCPECITTRHIRWKWSKVGNTSYRIDVAAVW